MEKTDKKVLYMNDHPTFRYVMGAMIVGVILFRYLWQYLLSPLSEIYRDAFTVDLFHFFPIIQSILVCVFFIILTFIPLNKSWKSVLVFESVSLCLSIFNLFLFIIEEYKYIIEANGDYDIAENIMRYLPSVLIDLCLIAFFLLPLSRRKFSKYLFIVFTGLVLFIQSYNFIAEVNECVEVFNYGFDGWCHVQGVLIDDSQEKYYFLSNVINLIPIWQIYFFIFAWFLKVPQKPKAETPPAFNNGNYAYYNYNNAPYTSAPAYNGQQPVYNTTPNNTLNSQVSNQGAYGYKPDVGVVPNGQQVVAQPASVNPVETQVAQFFDEQTVDVFTQANEQPNIVSKPSFCGQCGYKMSEGFMFCPKCGNKLTK